jgi:hypothetical protein
VIVSEDDLEDVAFLQQVERIADGLVGSPDIPLFVIDWDQDRDKFTLTFTTHARSPAGSGFHLRLFDYRKASLSDAWTRAKRVAGGAAGPIARPPSLIRHHVSSNGSEHICVPIRHLAN